MATTAELETWIADIDAALASIAAGDGVQRRTIGSVDITKYSLDQLIRLRDYWRGELNRLSGNTRNFAKFARPV